MLVAFAVYGVSIGRTLMMSIVLAAAFVIVPLWFWAVYMAPRAKNRITWPWTPVVALLLFLVASLALLLVHQWGWAMALATVAVLNAALTLIFRQE